MSFASFVSRFDYSKLFSFLRVRFEPTRRIAPDPLVRQDRCDGTEIRSLILTSLENLNHREELIGNDGSERGEALLHGERH